MTVKKALLLARMDPPDKNEGDWHNWYNHTHVANREKLPGFLSSRRFEKVEGLPAAYHTPGQARYLALYDVSSIRVLTGKAYGTVREKEFATPPDSYENQSFRLPKFARLIYRQIYPENEEYTTPGTKYVFLVGHDVPPNKHREFNAWYSTEHIPDLLSVPGFVAVRRFVLDEKIIPPVTDRGGVSSQYLTIWDLESEEALTCDEFINKSASPWTQWIRSWYTRKVCTLYRQIYPHV
jgi:hypothetical protein